MKSKTKPKNKAPEKVVTNETLNRQHQASKNLRSLAKQGNSKQLFRLIAMQKPAKKPKEKEADK